MSTREKELQITQLHSHNSLRPSDAIWRQKTGSTLAQVMTCCLASPSHYLKQCWLFISKDMWHSCEHSFTIDTSAINHRNWLQNYFSEISLKSPRSQWVKSDIALLLHVAKCVLRSPMPSICYHSAKDINIPIRVVLLMTSSWFVWCLLCNYYAIKRSAPKLNMPLIKLFCTDWLVPWNSSV